MFDELNKYKKADHFFLEPAGDINKVCNAPADKAGVYIVYALIRGGVDMVYIGHCGEISKEGSFIIPTGGLKEDLINGKLDDELRKDVWLKKMKREGAEAIDVYWYVTHNDKFIDSPKKVADKILKKHKDIFGRLPRWNVL